MEDEEREFEDFDEFEGFDMMQCGDEELEATDHMKSIVERAESDKDLDVLSRVHFIEEFVNAIRDYVDRACSGLMPDQLERETAFARLMCRGIEMATEGKYMEVEPTNANQDTSEKI